MFFSSARNNIEQAKTQEKQEEQQKPKRFTRKMKDLYSLCSTKEELEEMKAIDKQLSETISKFLSTTGLYH